MREGVADGGVSLRCNQGLSLRPRATGGGKQSSCRKEAVNMSGLLRCARNDCIAEMT